ncbi:hypothetical protein HQ524_00930 [Candidatus Uhrbacteria bacterium]|nr:hypothetical protein [Candidatus Uhrbacteria bacterium]
MPHPWSKMSEEEYARRKSMMHIVMLGGGLIVVALFAVQIGVTFRTENKAVENDPFLAGQEFFKSIAEETQRSKDNIDALSDSIVNVLEDQAKQKVAKDAVINKLSENLGKEALPVNPDEVIDPVDSVELEEGDSAWEFEDEVVDL